MGIHLKNSVFTTMCKICLKPLNLREQILHVDTNESDSWNKLNELRDTMKKEARAHFEPSKLIVLMLRWLSNSVLNQYKFCWMFDVTECQSFHEF